MEYQTKYHGGCLCGAVRVAARAKSHDIDACHCTMCRKWGGGPFFAVQCEDDVDFEGIKHISVFSSSDWAERGFCQECGTHLFYRLKQGGHYALPVGLLDDGHQWQLAEQIFIDRKPAFYSFAEKTRELTGEAVFARFSGE